MVARARCVTARLSVEPSIAEIDDRKEILEDFASKAIPLSFVA